MAAAGPAGKTLAAVPLLTPPPPARASAYQPICDPAPTREDAVYCQTAKAAEAQSQSAKWAFADFIVGLVGVVAIVLILWFTRRAAQAAAKAAGVAEKALRDLERPYLFVHGIGRIHTPPEAGYRPRLVYNVTNSGKLAARIDTISIACGPDNNGALPPLKIQDRHCLLQRPILSADEERRSIIHELLGESFVRQQDGNSGVDFDLDDGVVFQILIEYRGSAGQLHETGQLWKYHKSDGEWVEVADPHHTYMT